MVYYSSSNEYILNLIITFSSMTSSENIKISEVKSFIANKDDIFFIPIYGEEELSAEWESFLKKYAKNKCNIGKKTYFYLYGIYDLEIDKDATIVRQINNILKFLSVQIKIFPLKIMLGYTPIDSLIYYYNHSNYSHTDNNLVDNIIFLSKQELMINDLKTVDFTAKLNGYSSVIDKLKLKNKIKFLTQTLSSLKCENIILNRVKNINMDKVLKKSTNKKVLKLQLKSNRLKKSKSLSGFLSLEVLNLTANAFEMINIDYLSTKIKSLNLSKNNIKKVKIKKIRLKMKKLILFNNKITNMSFLSKLTNIEYLNIGLNPIEKFPDAIFKLTKIKHLNISFLNINTIPIEILNLKQLISIDITGSRILNNNNILAQLNKKGVKIIS
ncbi:leucine-rich repeat domain-containing protein [Aliarcobacter cryaerophilus]|uniref:leucine-rich repeat domain-containing protein n=1 Tax=Aliarcobacter cryaerophilus TaxID=28198 RepID=UPI003DA4D806